jgi:DNA-directed RNA polymerase specialized sigma24 family protein
MSDSSVSVWMRQLMAGDVDAPAQRLWERYFLRLVGLARAKLGHLPRRVADEEDVALSAFHSFCAAAGQGRFPQLKDRDDLWGLLVTITARKAYQQRLRLFCQKRGGNAVLDQAALTNPKSQRGSGDAGQDSALMSLDQFLGHEPTPEFAAQAAEEYERLLAALPDPELRAIAQWKMEGFTNEEIAAKLECAIRSVERRLHVIRAVWNQPDDSA